MNVRLHIKWLCLTTQQHTCIEVILSSLTQDVDVINWLSFVRMTEAKRCTCIADFEARSEYSVYACSQRSSLSMNELITYTSGRWPEIWSLVVYDVNCTFMWILPMIGDSYHFKFNENINEARVWDEISKYMIAFKCFITLPCHTLWLSASCYINSDDLRRIQVSQTRQR